MTADESGLCQPGVGAVGELDSTDVKWPRNVGLVEFTALRLAAGCQAQLASPATPRATPGVLRRFRGTALTPVHTHTCHAKITQLALGGVCAHHLIDAQPATTGTSTARTINDQGGFSPSPGSKEHARLHLIRRLAPRLATAVVCGIMVSGCAPLPGSPHATPVSPQAYQTELRADGDALKAALDGIGAAPPLAPLASQVDSAAAALRAAAQRLTAIVPPTPYAAAQTHLVSALDQLADQLSGVGAQVQSRELCAAPSVTATLSSLPGADALRRVAPMLGPAGADLTAALPAPEPLPDRQENNGTVLRAPDSGRGEITAENVPDHDSVVTLSQDGRTVGSFYVTRDKTAQMTSIPDGTYDIFFTSGTDWDGKEFTRSCAFQRFDKPATFTTTETTYTHLTVVLSPTPNGNAQVVDVPPDSFPK